MLRCLHLAEMRSYWLSDLESKRPRVYRVQVLRQGQWYHPHAPNQQLVVDARLMEEIEHAFNEGVFGAELPVNLGHTDDSIDAKGWVRRVYRDGDALYADVEIVDPQVEQLVQQNRLKYASAELVLQWVDPETRRTVNALRAVALTNRPYIKNMQPIEPMNLSEFMDKEDTMENQNVTLSLDEYLAMQDRLARYEELESEVSELREATGALIQTQRESMRETLLSEFRDAIPPSLYRLFELAFRHADEGNVCLSEFKEYVNESTVYELNLSESPASERVHMQDLLYALLSEVASLGLYNRRYRMESGRIEAPTHHLRGDTTDRLLQQARELARSEGLDLGEAVKRVMRDRGGILR